MEQWSDIRRRVLAEEFGNERMTGALLDRLTHHCHIFEINGESFRLRQAKKREQKKKRKLKYIAGKK